MVHICGKRYIDRVEDVTKVTVYSNQPAVELFANGVSLGVQENNGLPFFYYEVPNAGITHLVAKAGELTDESVINKVEVFNEAYRLREKSAILNWFEITMPEGYLSINSTFKEIMGTLQGKMLVMGLFGKVMSQMGGGDKKGGMDMSAMGGMMDMLGGFTFIRLAGMLGTMNVNFTKEELLDINAKLNKIKAPKK